MHERPRYTSVLGPHGCRKRPKGNVVKYGGNEYRKFPRCDISDSQYPGILMSTRR